MEGLEIREFRAADDEGVRAVIREAHGFLRKIYQRSKADRPAGQEAPFVRLVAMWDGIVGTVTYERKADSLYFGSLGVLESRRRRGVTRAIVKHLETVASGLGLRKLSCSTVKETGNVAIFEKLGFSVVSSALAARFKSPDGRPVHEVELEKVIK